MKFIFTICACLLAHSVMAGDFQPFQPLPPSPPIPADNPQTEDKIELGKQLFFDRRLSASRDLNCNTCHNLMAGGEDNRPLSRGEGGHLTRRSTPSLWNSAYNTVYFWDGRADSLEAAITEHLQDKVIMALDPAVLHRRLSSISYYGHALQSVFGSVKASETQRVARALASFIRTLVTTDGPYDRYLRGDRQAIPAEARQGFEDFIETGCASCHFWVNLAGPVPGLAFKPGEGFYELFPNFPGTKEEQQYQLSADPGRISVTGISTDRRMWRVPILRNVALTAPYFHNGKVTTLPEAVRVMARTQLGLDLDRDRTGHITAFLKTLTGNFPRISLPRLPAQD